MELVSPYSDQVLPFQQLLFLKQEKGAKELEQNKAYKQLSGIYLTEVLKILKNMHLCSSSVLGTANDQKEAEHLILVTVIHLSYAWEGCWC